MLALLKALFEQVFQPGFAVAQCKRGLMSGLFRGSSARIASASGPSPRSRAIIALVRRFGL